MEKLIQVLGQIIVVTLCAWGLFFRKKEMSLVKKWGLSILSAVLFLTAAMIIGTLLAIYG